MRAAGDRRRSCAESLPGSAPIPASHCASPVFTSVGVTWQTAPEGIARVDPFSTVTSRLGHTTWMPANSALANFSGPEPVVRHIADLDQRHGRRVGAGALVGQDDGPSRLPRLDIAVLIVEEQAIGAARVGIAVDGQGSGRVGGQIGRRRREARVPLREGRGTGARRTVGIDDAEVGRRPAGRGRRATTRRRRRWSRHPRPGASWRRRRLPVRRVKPDCRHSRRYPRRIPPRPPACRRSGSGCRR